MAHLTFKVIQPYGPCHAVSKTKDFFDTDLSTYPKPWYLTDVPVHDDRYGDELKVRGFRMLPDNYQDIHEGTVFISSHGLAQCKKDALKAQGLTLVDLTCRFVQDIHTNILDALERGKPTYFLGKKGTQECNEILGEGDVHLIQKGEKPILPENAYLTSQTTMVKDAFDAIVEVNAYTPGITTRLGLCGECLMRQGRLRQALKDADAAIIVGSRSSANTRALFDIAQIEKPTIWVECQDDMDVEFLMAQKNIIVASGTSADSDLCSWVTDYLAKFDYAKE